MSQTAEFSPAQQKDFQDLVEYGFNPRWQAERRNKLTSRFGILGQEIADYEDGLNKNLFQSEFIDDHSSSPVFVYGIKNNKFFTQVYDDGLFAIEKGINADERKGVTLSGYRKFCQTQLDNPGKVAVWYSPGGEDIGCDTGRLYVGFVDSPGLTVNFNLKILEGRFPILDLLNSLSDREEKSLFEYLKKPLNTDLTVNDFFGKVRSLSLVNEIIYISHRLPDDPRPKREYRLKEVIDQIQEELMNGMVSNQADKLNYFKHRIENFVYQPVGDMTTIQLERMTQSIRAGYYQIMKQASRDGVTFLYGCSATGKKSAVFNSAIDKLMQSENAISIFDTGFRSLSPINLKEDYKNDPNLCQCGQPKEAHFHCPGRTKNNEECHHPIIVGEGTTQCPRCQKKAVCN